jgi:hypothetical protein
MKMNVKCRKCSKTFKSNYKLNLHQRVHEKKFKCDQCDAAFLNSHPLKLHVKSKHEGERYPCTYPGCAFQSLTKASVGRHLRDMHYLEGTKYEKYRKRLTVVKVQNMLN